MLIYSHTGTGHHFPWKYNIRICFFSLYACNFSFRDISDQGDMLFMVSVPDRLHNIKPVPVPIKTSWSFTNSNV